MLTALIISLILLRWSKSRRFLLTLALCVLLIAAALFDWVRDAYDQMVWDHYERKEAKRS